jgi:N-acyl-D-amino-acid deacylase
MNAVLEVIHDTAIRGGHLIDGTGAPRMRCDVLVKDGLVSALVPPGEGSAAAELDATGKIVCPGFIDVHSHDDLEVLTPAHPNAKLSQGVSTVVTGNCGISLAPLVTNRPPPPLDLLGPDAFRYDSFQEYLHALDRASLQVNVVPLIGHMTVRVRHVQDLSRPAEPGQIAAMYADVSNAMEAGAFGLSTGVYYPPAAAADLQELKGVAAALRGRNALLASHLRDEGDHVAAALTEAFEVARDCGARLIVSHHKVVGAQNHGRTQETLRQIEDAATSLNVCLDCYPYDASSTMLVPGKAAAIGNVLITWSKPFPELSGQTLRSIAQQWSCSLTQAAEQLMPGGAIYFSMSEVDVQRVLAHPLTMIGSDGLPHDARPHPRLWGSFPRVLGHYSRELKLFPLEAAVHKMSGLPAQRLGLHNRGEIRVGWAADLVVFDPLEVADCATYTDPERPATGIDAVFVNGALAARQGVATGATRGRRLLPCA